MLLLALVEAGCGVEVEGATLRGADLLCAELLVLLDVCCDGVDERVWCEGEGWKEMKLVDGDWDEGAEEEYE